MPLTAANIHFDALVSGTGWHTLIEAPDPGTSILINKIYLSNTAWTANWVIVRAHNVVTGEIFAFIYEAALGAFGQRSAPGRGRDGPIVLESGWELQCFSDTISVYGMIIEVNYGIDTGYGDQPSDYHSNMTKCDAGSGEVSIPIVAPAPDYKIRHAKSICAWNEDTASHACWVAMRDAGGGNYTLLMNMGNLTSLQIVHFPFSGEGITVNEDTEVAFNKGSADAANSVKVWCSWLEAGGYEDIGPSDTGPWTRSQQIIQRRSIALDGQLDRLMTYPTVAAGIGIANYWTLLVWSRPTGWQTNAEHLFMLGGLSNPGAIHLGRNTDPGATGTDHPYEIEVHEGSTTKKLYRFSPGFVAGVWECVAITFDGDASDGAGYEKLQVWKDGIKQGYFYVTRVVNDAIGVLTDTNRYIGLGGAPTGTGTNTDGFLGEIWNAAVWSRVLTDDELVHLSSRYNSHYDLRLSHGPYVAGVDLEHYYRPGLRYSPNLGEDFGLGGDLTDLTYEEDVTDADLVDNFPGKGLI